MTPPPGAVAVAVSVGGSELDASIAAKLVELVVDNELRVPDRLVARYRDGDLTVVDQGPFAIGAAITVRLAGAEESSEATVFDGQITALEPDFGERGAEFVVCALDRGHKLQREARTATYQDMSYGDIATQVALAAGLEAGEISSGLSLPFVQQSNETDWDFLWRLALDVDYQLEVSGRTLSFSAAGQTSGSPVRLAWGDTLLSFRPRVSGVQQVEEVNVRGWDITTASAIEATAEAPAPESTIGIDRDEVVSALGSGGATLVDHPVTSISHAQTLATSLAAQLASVYVEGEGTTSGTPALSAGSQAQVSGVGTTFSGAYAVTGVRHVYRGGSGYRTCFSISGRARRSLLGLAREPVRSGWAHRIVVGTVTSTEDPLALGRVRVKYPALDDEHDGWWARVVAPGAGAARGLFSLPQVGDEVLVVFEHGSEQHPYVIGSVYNESGKPDTVVAPDGSFTMATPHKVTITSTEAAAITTKDTLTLTSDGTAKVTTNPGDDEKAAGDIQLDSKGAVALTSGTDTTVTATGAVNASAKSGMTLGGGTEMTIKADGSVSISGGSIKLTGDSSVTISAPSISLG